MNKIMMTPHMARINVSNYIENAIKSASMRGHLNVTVPKPTQKTIDSLLERGFIVEVRIGMNEIFIDWSMKG